VHHQERILRTAADAFPAPMGLGKGKHPGPIGPRRFEHIAGLMVVLTTNPAT
jgi:hypothetical protein